MQVTNAITRKKKEEIVDQLSSLMEQSIVMFGVRHKGVKVGWLLLGLPASAGGPI